jgi:hypothetical protein
MRKNSTSNILDLPVCGLNANLLDRMRQLVTIYERITSSKDVTIDFRCNSLQFRSGAARRIHPASQRHRR